MPDGEDVVAICLAGRNVAVCSDRGVLRLMSHSGVHRAVYCLDYAPVCMAGSNFNHLALIMTTPAGSYRYVLYQFDKQVGLCEMLSSLLHLYCFSTLLRVSALFLHWFYFCFVISERILRLFKHLFCQHLLVVDSAPSVGFLSRVFRQYDLLGRLFRTGLRFTSFVFPCFSCLATIKYRQSEISPSRAC
jgi:hypothetical protein